MTQAESYGAWVQDYYCDGIPPYLGASGGRLKDVVKSIQTELAYNNYPTATIDGIFGPGTQARVVDYQKGTGLRADGIVGPITARALCQLRIHTYSNNVSVDPDITGGIIRVESSYDFGAVGYINHMDRGLGQINAVEVPYVPDVWAFDSAFSIKFVADSVRKYLRVFKNNQCAIAAYNLGERGAIAWCKNPSSNPAVQQYVDKVLQGA